MTEKKVTAREHVKGELRVRQSYGLFNCFVVKDCVARFDWAKRSLLIVNSELNGLDWCNRLTAVELVQSGLKCCVYLFGHKRSQRRWRQARHKKTKSRQTAWVRRCKTLLQPFCHGRLQKCMSWIQVFFFLKPIFLLLLPWSWGANDDYIAQIRMRDSTISQSLYILTHTHWRAHSSPHTHT